MILNIFLIAIGGAIGSILRYLVSIGSYTLFTKSLPIGTFIVNSCGCLLIGFLSVIIFDRFNGISEQLRAILLIGFLGGFTTFSSFSLETLNLFAKGQLFYAFANILLSIISCLLLTWIGIIIGRQI